MKTLLSRVFVHIHVLRDDLLREDHGQDLIEYALVAALIALAATVGMNSVATNINAAFTSLGTKLTNYTS